jgi:hypothetical protein
MHTIGVARFIAAVEQESSMITPQILHIPAYRLRINDVIGGNWTVFDYEWRISAPLDINEVNIVAVRREGSGNVGEATDDYEVISYSPYEVVRVVRDVSPRAEYDSPVVTKNDPVMVV